MSTCVYEAFKDIIGHDEEATSNVIINITAFEWIHSPIIYDVYINNKSLFYLSETILNQILLYCDIWYILQCSGNTVPEQTWLVMIFIPTPFSNFITSYNLDIPGKWSVYFVHISLSQPINLQFYLQSLFVNWSLAFHNICVSGTTILLNVAWCPAG